MDESDSSVTSVGQGMNAKVREFTKALEVHVKCVKSPNKSKGKRNDMVLEVLRRSHKENTSFVHFTFQVRSVVPS
ncbi:hypothetical protein PPTG_23972 [Phytophthora nicotianae INRA-310]|uniref:Uncharacterized protein n=1 Tax=Phytophthora nicotianae (strain INRA-310) TaxID=761204 RepID=W2PN73_PHYN3|nr:hypothetical protein PPTG_23972 [Phytophthora nicotianae INRA-310]ETN02081.1 hypothetical protein PPTG_23972 [Phytophthora nicotianae INRA-310]